MLLDDIELVCGESEIFCAVGFFGDRIAEKGDHLAQRLVVSFIGEGEDNDLVSDSLDRIFTVGQAVHNLCGFGIRGCSDKDLKGGAVVAFALLYPVVAELGVNVRDVIDDFSKLTIDKLMEKYNRN